MTSKHTTMPTCIMYMCYVQWTWLRVTKGWEAIAFPLPPPCPTPIHVITVETRLSKLPSIRVCWLTECQICAAMPNQHTHPFCSGHVALSDHYLFISCANGMTKWKNVSFSELLTPASIQRLQKKDFSKGSLSISWYIWQDVGKSK